MKYLYAFSSQAHLELVFRETEIDPSLPAANYFTPNKHQVTAKNRLQRPRRLKYWTDRN